MLASHGLRAATRDEFLAGLIKDHRVEMIDILRKARLCLKQPPLAAAEYLATLTPKVSHVSARCWHLSSMNSNEAMYAIEEAWMGAELSEWC